MSSGLRKTKALLKQSKGKKKKEQILEDADDYLAAAVDDEDAMGKHRGGDPIKSLRFARKALDLYTQGLSKYPQNFDLAYNKARLELEIATHPSLVKALDVPVPQVLQQALTSHRYAISLNPDNADTLFNTAQVLTTIAEYVAKDDSISDTEALSYLEEALERQNQCLQIQQARFTESRGLHEAAMNQNRNLEDDEDDIEDDDGGAKLDSSTKSAFEDQTEDQQEQWVSIIEPVTANTLIDTILSQLSTLTTLCTLLTSSASSLAASSISPSWIESYSTNLTSNILPALTSDPANTETLLPRASEIHRTKAIFTTSLLDLAFHTNSITPETYISSLTGAFSTSDVSDSETKTEIDNDPETQIAHARALITLNSSLSELSHKSSTPSQSSSSSTPTPLPTHRWTTLSKASTILTKASSLPTTKASPYTHATTHLLRGDTALLLYALSHPPISHPQAVSNKAQLLKNAEVFYRNAGKLFGSAGGEGEDEGAAARWRGGIVEVLKIVEESGSGSAGVDRERVRKVLEGVSVGKSGEWRREQMGDMVDEGLVEGVELPL